MPRTGVVADDIEDKINWPLINDFKFQWVILTSEWCEKSCRGRNTG